MRTPGLFYPMKTIHGRKEYFMFKFERDDADDDLVFCVSFNPCPAE